MLVKRKGSHEIQQKLGQTTYQMTSPDQPHSSRVLHINLLKEWMTGPKAAEEVLFIKYVQEDVVAEEHYVSAVTPQDLDLYHLSEGKQSQERNLYNSNVFQWCNPVVLILKNDSIHFCIYVILTEWLSTWRRPTTIISVKDVSSIFSLLA